MAAKRSEAHVLVGVCGASGLIYARLALDHLVAAPGVRVHVVASRAAFAVADAEGGRADLDASLARAHHNYSPDRLDACVASGSFPLAGMVIAPCSLHTAMALAAGLADDLLLRAGQVCLKERRPLVLLLRETPLAAHHLRHLAELSEAGAVVMPAAPGFYHRPGTLDQLADPLVLRALSFLRLPQLPLPPAWGAEPGPID
jgi:flavin prenyltransferase